MECAGLGRSATWVKVWVPNIGIICSVYIICTICRICSRTHFAQRRGKMVLFACAVVHVPQTWPALLLYLCPATCALPL
eukprot:175661-Chlamydomonas_euryale.AAC.5